ncbi:STAS domain-containing protein [Jeotgalibacillus aurantiacus]|uniref:STAS domain-containing protein n=1 Tax=Jeotgalibacillus aurantiacus TaxID=2763266 RepID=UPI001D0A1969|nr:STAS domain-containing protein [Jeotgalibacillus aurantiacus]
MGSVQALAAYLDQYGEKLGEKLMEYSLGKMDIEIPDHVIEQSRKTNAPFFHFLSKALLYKEDQQVADEFLEWSRQNSEAQAAMMDKLSSLIKPYPETRMYFSKLMGDLCLEHELSARDTLHVLNRLNYMMDISLKESILVFEQYKNAINEENRKEILALSAPIVPLQHGVAVLPLIGTIDPERANHLLTKTAPAISELGLETVIIDFSGLVSIDSEVAGHVFDITNVLKLLGIGVIMSGMRPSLAQHVILTGINFSSIRTFSNVKQALESMHAID